MPGSPSMAFVFPGQGSQYPGMGKALSERFPEAEALLEEAQQVLGFDLKKKLFEGTEEELRQTSVTQPAIYAVSCACFAVLQSRAEGLTSRAAFAAGHSLGEYAALFAAQVFDFKTGLKLVQYRGQFIQESCEKRPGTMAALLGFERAELEGLCRECSTQDGGFCVPVNFNGPGQTVVAGTREAVAALVQKAQGLPGKRAVPLNVSGAFHSELVSEAAQKMAAVLDSVPFRDARIPVVGNCDAEPETRAAAFKRKLVTQIDHPVLWEDSVRRMASQGSTTFIECGPGKVLTGLLRKIDKACQGLNVEDPASLEKALAALGAPAA